MRKYVIFSILACFGLSMYSQNSSFRSLDVIQRNLSNPASGTDANWYFSLPGLHSFGGWYYNDAFSYQDIFKINDQDSLIIDGDNLLTKLGPDNRLIMGLDHQVLKFGFGFGTDNYLHFGFAFKGMTDIRYTETLPKILWNGNAPYLGQEQSINPDINMLVAMEYSVHYAREINEDLRIGIGLKLLNGLIHMETERINFNWTSDPNDANSITGATDIHFLSAGIGENPFSNTNLGFGIDLGFEYQTTPYLTLHGSVTDLGFINWKSSAYETKSKSPGQSVYFQGFPVTIGGESINTGIDFETVVDSLSAAFELQDIETNYKSNLPSKFTIGGEYILADKHQLGIAASGHILPAGFLPEAQLYYRYDLAEWIDVALTYRVLPSNYTNLGMAMNLKIGAVNLFGKTDSFIGFFSPTSRKYANTYFGINFLFDGNEKETVNAN